MILDNKQIKYITLYTGTKGYHNCYCKCPCCTQRNVNEIYQGTKEQTEELLSKFANLEQLYILGNPDPLVDNTFCNETSKMAIKKDINVCYSTSGVGGIKKMEKLIEGVDSSRVDYISFSIDSIDKEKMSYLKGINYPFDEVIKTIKWLQDRNYKIKIQPTLWSCNYQEAYQIIEYFANMGVDWFTFHIGSNETNVLDTHTHLNLEQMKKVHELLERASKLKVKISCPTIYKELNYDDSKKWYCMNINNCNSLLAFFSDNIYVTTLPILATPDSKYLRKLSDNMEVEELESCDICPASSMAAKQKTMCRYVKKNWN